MHKPHHEQGICCQGKQSKTFIPEIGRMHGLDTCKLGLIYQNSECPCCHIKHDCRLCRLFIDCCVAQWKKARLQNVLCVRVAFFHWSVFKNVGKRKGTLRRGTFPILLRVHCSTADVCRLSSVTCYFCAFFLSMQL